MLFPGPYRVPIATWRTTSVFSNTSGRTAYRDRAFETVAAISLDTLRAEWAWIPSTCGSEHPRREFPVRQLTDEVQLTVLAGAQQALELIDYDGFRREQARLVRRRHPGIDLSYVTPPRLPWVITAQAPRSGSSLPAPSTCTWRAGRPGTV
jgi:carbon-monoxide dehydrogenase large subunit